MLTKFEQAKRAIDNLYGDTRVPLGKTLDNMLDLRDLISERIETLEDELSP